MQLNKNYIKIVIILFILCNIPITISNHLRMSTLKEKNLQCIRITLKTVNSNPIIVGAALMITFSSYYIFTMYRDWLISRKFWMKWRE